jgi:hypothetical protein
MTTVVVVVTMKIIAPRNKPVLNKMRNDVREGESQGGRGWRERKRNGGRADVSGLAFARQSFPSLPLHNQAVVTVT